jgi:hypothetical protein
MATLGLPQILQTRSYLSRTATKKLTKITKSVIEKRLLAQLITKKLKNQT